MDPQKLTIVCAATALLLHIPSALLHFGYGARITAVADSSDASAPVRTAELANTVDALGQRVHALERGAGELSDSLRAALHEMRETSTRVTVADGVGSIERTHAQGTDAAAASAPAPEPTVVVDADRLLAFESALDQLVNADYDANYGERMESFRKLVRGTTLIDDRIAELRARVDATPTDVDARLALADTFVGKLLTVSGAEMGIWGSRAEAEWSAVTAIDPQHWRANFKLGQNFAFYPDAMDKTGDAISHLEAARTAQRSLQVAPEHKRTFELLARMYLRRGDRERAREVLDEALRTFPGDESLRDARQRL